MCCLSCVGCCVLFVVQRLLSIACVLLVVVGLLCWLVVVCCALFNGCGVFGCHVSSLCLLCVCCRLLCVACYSYVVVCVLLSCVCCALYSHWSLLFVLCNCVVLDGVSFVAGYVLFGVLCLLVVEQFR